MSRSDWSVVAAIIGCLILAGLAVAINERPLTPSSVGRHQAARQGAAYTETKRLVSQTVVAPEAHDATAKDTGCPDSQDRRDSDLCAQWKAADAAQNAANYGLAALILSAVGTGLLIWTLRETRTTTRRELRAYVYAKGLVWQRLDVKGVTHIEIKVVWSNAGATPAKRAVFGATCAIYERGADTSIPLHIKITSPNAAHFGPNVELYSPPVLLTEQTVRNAFSGKQNPVLYGRIDYLDAFDVARETRVAFQLNVMMDIGQPTSIKNMVELRWSVVGPHNGADGD